MCSTNVPPPRAAASAARAICQPVRPPRLLVEHREDVVVARRSGCAPAGRPAGARRRPSASSGMPKAYPVPRYPVRMRSTSRSSSTNPAVALCGPGWPESTAITRAPARSADSAITQPASTG